jgi:hypothetical protein
MAWLLPNSQDKETTDSVISSPNSNNNIIFYSKDSGNSAKGNHQKIFSFFDLSPNSNETSTPKTPNKSGTIRKLNFKKDSWMSHHAQRVITKVFKQKIDPQLQTCLKN